MVGEESGEGGQAKKILACFFFLELKIVIENCKYMGLISEMDNQQLKIVLDTILPTNGSGPIITHIFSQPKFFLDNPTDSKQQPEIEKRKIAAAGRGALATKLGRAAVVHQFGGRRIDSFKLWQSTVFLRNFQVSIRYVEN